MAISSHLFIFYFLPLVVTIYHLLPARNAVRNSFLTFCGYIFYAWWNPWFMLLMLGTTALDYNLGKMIVNAGDDQRRKKLGVTLSVTSNLALLAFFKHTAFAVDSAQGVANWAAWGQIPVPGFFLSVVLPVGISFYIFQSLSYCIDLYRSHAKPADSYLDFACFVSLFPHLVGGPIVRHGIIADQLHNRVHTVEGFALGLTRFGFGLSKKILLADPMGAIADGAFGAGAGLLTTPTAWIGLIAYAFQIYFDFSAYSDIAVGLARTMGFDLVENFASPYKSVSITDFWRRWHISLSTFLRDCLYIPLGGNRKGSVRTCVNLMLTMLIAGLWHGAQWTFIIWGAIHGGMLALERLMGKNPPYARVPHGLRVAFTFFIVLIAWVFFRADSFGIAMRYLGVMFGGGTVLPPALLLQAELGSGFNVLQLLIAGLVVWFAPNTQTILRRFKPVFAINHRAAWAFAITFMAVLWIPPLWEHAVRIANGNWSATPAANLVSWRPSHGPLFERLHAVEKTLDNSLCAVALRRAVQGWLTHDAQQGNRKVHIGYNDMLFYRPDLRALTGFGPLTPEPFSVIKDPGLAKVPPARDVVFKFAEQLKDRGVSLLIVPVPLKPMIYPELLTADTSHEWMTHPDAAAFYNELRAKDIDVLDLTADLAKLRNRRRHVFVRVPDAKDKAATAQAEAEAKEPTEAFLRQDTHWTPEAMRFAAEKISAHVKRKYPHAIHPRFKEIRAVDSVQRESIGDLVKLLDLEHPAQTFSPEPVLLKVIAEGTEDRDSPIVLLGDSLVNVFDDPSLGFENPAKPTERIRAGFAQTLALRLQQPLDLIAINGKGSTEVRKSLAARPDDEVRAKKVVIWVIAARDLLLSRSAARDANIEWADVVFSPE